MPGSDLAVRAFGGIVSAIDRRLVPDGAAFDSLNVVTVNGRAAHRPGWEQVGAAPSGFTGTAHTVWPLKGSTSSSSLDEFFTVVNRGSGYRPWSVDPATGAYTEIKEQTVSVALTGGEWQAIVFDGVAYCFLPGGDVYKHDVGDDDDFELVDAARPDDLYGTLAILFSATETSGAKVDGTAIAWTGATGSTVVADAPASTGSVSVVSGWLQFATTGWSSGSAVKWTFTFPGGVADLSAQNSVRFTVRWPSGNNEYSIPAGYPVVKLVNADGSPVTQTLTVTTATKSLVGSYWNILVEAEFEAGFDPALWDNTAKMELTLWGENSAGNDIMEVSQLVPMSGGALTPSADVVRCRFGIVSYDGSRDVEGENVLPGGWMRLDPAQRWYADNEDTFLGNVPQVQVPHSAEAQVTATRVYIQFESDGLWRLVETVAEPTGTLDVDMPYSILAALPTRVNLAANPLGEVVCACSYRGWTVWGKARGTSNLLHSAVGNPTKLARSSDDTEDVSRGANWTLADDNSDEPLWMGQAGRALVILGRLAAYVQTGDFPSTMSPSARLAQSKGLYGRHAACRFRDQVGNPGIAYVAKDMRVYFLTATQVDPDGEYGFKVEEMGAQVRDEVKTFLGSGSAPDAERLFMFADEYTDSLWVCYGAKALRLSTRSLVDGQRHYGKHTFTHSGGASWRGFCSHPDHGVRAIRSTGAIDTIWRDVDGVEITGTTMDNGAAPPAAYWQSGLFTSEDRRSVQTVRVERTTTTAIGCVVESDRANDTLTVPASTDHARVAWNVMGRDIGFKVTVPADGTEIVSVTLRQNFGLGRETNK